MILEDGTGNGYKARVDGDNRLRVYAVTEDHITHSSETEGNSYVWTATADWGADKNALWLRNDNTSARLAIETISVSPAAACQIEIGIGSGNTVGGTEVTGSNLNLGSGNVAEATCRHTNTNCDASAGLTVIKTFWGAVKDNEVNYRGALMLDYLGEVGIGLITDVGSTTVTITGYYHE